MRLIAGISRLPVLRLRKALNYFNSIEFLSGKRVSLMLEI